MAVAAVDLYVVGAVTDDLGHGLVRIQVFTELIKTGDLQVAAGLDGTRCGFEFTQDDS